MDKFEELNHEFVAKSEPIIRIIMIVRIPISVILDILVWRRRNLAIYITYDMLIRILLHGFMPFDYGDFYNLVVEMVMMQAFIFTVSDLRHNIISSTVVHLMILFVAHPIVYNQEWTYGMVFGKISSALFPFGTLTLFSMMITYIAQIRCKLNNLMQENLNLLDRMHEGLIVLSQG